MYYTVIKHSGHLKILITIIIIIIIIINNKNNDIITLFRCREVISLGRDVYYTSIILSISSRFEINISYANYFFLSLGSCGNGLSFVKVSER